MNPSSPTVPPPDPAQPWRAAVALTLLAAFLVGVSPAVMDWGRMFPDFICYWAAGKILAAGGNPYDPALQARVQGEYGWDRQRDGLGLYDYLPFYYPPWFGLLFVPLLPLGFAGARTAWYFLNVEGVLLGGYLLSGVPSVPRRLPLWLAPVFLFTLASVLLGQTATFVFFVLALSWRLLEEGRDRAAGAALAWLTVKPQLTAVLLLGLLLWLARRGRWRAVGAFLLTSALLAGGSALVLPDWPVQMLNAIRQTPSPTEYYPWIGNAWLLVLRSLGLGGPLLWAAYLALAVPFLVAVARAALSPAGRLADVLALGALAAFFVAPYARHYDFPVLLVPLLVAVGRLPRVAGWALVALLTVAPYVQLLLLAQYKAQQPEPGKFLVESTFFWVPLLLAAVWPFAARRRPP
jgi:hypothetical protein